MYNKNQLYAISALCYFNMMMEKGVLSTLYAERRRKYKFLRDTAESTELISIVIQFKFDG